MFNISYLQKLVLTSGIRQAKWGLYILYMSILLFTMKSNSSFDRKWFFFNKLYNNSLPSSIFVIILIRVLILNPVFYQLLLLSNIWKIVLCSGKMSWEQVLRYASLRKKYISLYAALLKSDNTRAVVDDNSDIEEMDRELDIELIIQWRYCSCGL